LWRKKNFALRIGSKEKEAYGDLIADGVISRLARSNSMRVLSRFSTASLRDASVSSSSIEQLLGANYALRGDFSLINDRIMISYELTNTQTQEVLISDKTRADLADLFEQSSEVCQEIAYKAINAIIDEQLQASLNRPLPTLASYSLFLMGVGGIHRSIPKKNEAGEAALKHILERHPRSPEPAVWLAQWIAIKANRGLSDNVSASKATAQRLLLRALEIEPENSFGLSVSGLIDAYFDHRFDLAEKKYDQALVFNPNDYLAWLYKSTLLAWNDQSDKAMYCAQRALALSKLHPMRYYIESLAALPFLVGGQYEIAEQLSQSSLRINKTHSSTYRLLACAQVLSGKESEAYQTIQKMKLIEPSMTLAKFLDRYPGKDSKFKSIYAHSLKIANLN
jgi:adenylate cyclase